MQPQGAVRWGHHTRLTKKARLATPAINHTRSCGEELRACFAPGAAAGVQQRPVDKMDVDGAAKDAGAAAKGEATRNGAASMEEA